MKKKIKIYIPWIILSLLSILFIFITVYVCNELTTNFDNNIYNLIKPLINDTNTTIFKLITEIGSYQVLLILTIIFLVFNKKKKNSKILALNMLISTLVNTIIKEIIRRPRPIGISIITEKSYSFPSGHSMITLAFTGLLIYFIYKSNYTKLKKILYISSLSIITLLVGISRIYLGVHFASDVIAGFILAIIYLIIYLKIIYRKRTTK